MSTDANWCGCKLTRKSASGASISKGKHLIKAWSKTQSILAKSTAESELYGFKGACEGLGVSTLLKDLGEVSPQFRMHVDATAAKGIIERKGLNKLRHIELDILWLQEQKARKLLPLDKLLGTDNVADLMTKNLPAATIERYIDMMSLKFAECRSAIAQMLHSVNPVAIDDVEPVGSKPIKSRRDPDKSVGPTTYNKPEAYVNIQTIFDQDESSKKKGIDNRDRWCCLGVGGIWKREHLKTRRVLFTPMRVSQGPPEDAHMSRIRITKGVNVETMETFSAADDWTQSENAHPETACDQ